MKILIAGDFCPCHRVVEKFEKGDYESVLGEAKKIISDTDYSIVNLECPVCKGGEKPIDKLGPNLKCSETGIKALKWAGFNCVTLANNHFYDYGEKGVANTLTACTQNGIDYVGGGKDISEASQILYKTIGEQILAVINCCEHEFSIATTSSGGSNPLNPVQQYYAIQEAKTKADFILVIVHGGHEQYQLPSPRMKELYHFFIDIGADAVVNHHQHCYSGYELYNNKPIFYGIGNFCFDRDGILPKGWTEGYIVKILFKKGQISSSIYPYNQCGKEPCVRLMETNTFDGTLNLLNFIISDDKQLQNHILSYCHDSMENVAYTIEPIQNRYIVALQHRKLLPSLWSKKWLLKLQNYILCESHRDKLEYFVKNFKKNKNNTFCNLFF